MEGDIHSSDNANGSESERDSDAGCAFETARALLAELDEDDEDDTPDDVGVADIERSLEAPNAGDDPRAEVADLFDDTGDPEFDRTVEGEVDRGDVDSAVAEAAALWRESPAAPPCWARDCGAPTTRCRPPRPSPEPDFRRLAILAPQSSRPHNKGISPRPLYSNATRQLQRTAQRLPRPSRYRARVRPETRHEMV